MSMILSLRRKGFCALLIVMLALANVGADSTCADSCPVVSISCVPDEKCCCQTYTFAANISGGYPEKVPTYKWSVSAGRIMNGQGTSEIEVDGSGVAGDIEVKVEVRGIQPEGCPSPTSVSYRAKCGKK